MGQKTKSLCLLNTGPKGSSLFCFLYSVGLIFFQTIIKRKNKYYQIILLGYLLL